MARRWSTLGPVACVICALAAVAAILIPAGAAEAASVTMPYVTVGDAGNPADANARGAVDHAILMGTYEVTNAQYAAFLNAVAATDTYGLYNSAMGITRSGSAGSFGYATAAPNLPVTYVSWTDAARFVNWLHNGQPAGAQSAATTEDGAYTFTDATTVGPRHADARVFVPNDDEWYKAAYYRGGVNGGYWTYPTRSDAAPGAAAPSSGGNQANFGNVLTGAAAVGSYTGSAGTYGTYDQAGNVWEWTETGTDGRRVLRGGSWNDYALLMQADYRDSDAPAAELPFTGFRVAAAAAPGPPAPVATDDDFNATENVALQVSAPGVLGNDTVDTGTLTAAKVTDPSHGTLGLNTDGSFLYTPASNFSGADTFTYRASANGVASNVATVTVHVAAVNQAPQVDAGPDRAILITATAALAGVVNDDGLVLSTPTLAWSKDSGPGIVNFTDAAAAATTAGFSAPGHYVLRLTANDGALSASDTMAVDVAGVATLQIEKRANVNRVSAGSQIVYTLTCRNIGSAAATGVTVRDVVPTQTTYNSGSATAGGVYTAANRTVTWTPGTLAAGTEVSMSFAVTVDATVTGGGSVSNNNYTAASNETPTVAGAAVDIAVDDTTPPTVSGCVPAAGSTQAPLNTIIRLHVTDAGAGVAFNGVTIRVNGDVIYDGAHETAAGKFDTRATSQATRGLCSRTGAPADYAFIFQSATPFRREHRVTVAVDAADLSGNAMPQARYSFTTMMPLFGANLRVNQNTSAAAYDLPATVADSQGTVWAAWEQQVSGSQADIYISHKAQGESSFAAGVAVLTNPADQRRPRLAVDKNGRLWLVWQDRRSGNWNIYASSSTDGLAWTAPAPVAAGVNDQTQPSVACAPDGHIYVAWQEQAGNADIWLASSTDGGLWTPVRITTDAHDQTEPALAVNADGTVYVLWTDARNGNRDIFGADSAHGPWTNQPVVVAAADQYSPAFGVEDEGHTLHILWVDESTGNADIRYARSDNGLPASPLAGVSIVDDATSAAQIHPALTVRGHGDDATVFAAWEDYRNGQADPDIYYAEAHESFGTNILVNNDRTTRGQFTPALGVDANGRAYVVWADERDGKRNIYFAGGTASRPPIGSRAPVANLLGSLGGAVEVQTGANGGISGVADTSSDCRVDVPAGALAFEVDMSIAMVDNAPPLPLSGVGSPWELGPGNLTFDKPVTVTMPYDTAVDGQYATYFAYWYDPATDAWRQDGISNVHDVLLSGTLHTVVFDTTHFTMFAAAGSTGTVSGGGSGGGGCAMTTQRQAGPWNLLPYVLLALLLAAGRMLASRKAC